MRGGGAGPGVLPIICKPDPESHDIGTTWIDDDPEKILLKNISRFISNAERRVRLAKYLVHDSDWTPARRSAQGGAKLSIPRQYVPNILILKTIFNLLRNFIPIYCRNIY
jgi:hypothetical protein